MRTRAVSLPEERLVITWEISGVPRIHPTPAREVHGNGILRSLLYGKAVFVGEEISYLKPT